MIVTLFLCIFLISWMLTSLVRNYALKNQILDIPNHRSSHALPTPRGGGLGFVITSQIGFYFLYATDYLTLDVYLALLIAGSIVAAISFIDDHRHLHPLSRITFHIIAASYCLYLLPEIGAVGGIVNIPLFIALPLILALVWLINLYNFMDGIDGLAAIQAMLVAGGAAIMLVSIGEYKFAVLWGVLLFAVMGFLLLNWPPAKIFMGDVGSSYLGMVIGCLALVTTLNTKLSLWTFILLLGYFIVDATATLLVRILKGEKWYQPHRSHAYQILAINYGRHSHVLVRIVLVNLVWLFPSAFLAAYSPDYGPYITVIALLPMTVWVLKVGAGGKAEKYS
jgi:Fuc2NAc and GlcNAc transferase